MKAIILFLIGLILWLTSKAFGEFYWVHQAKLGEIALLFSVLSVIVLISQKENRESLTAIFRIKGFADLPQFIEQGGLTTLFVALFYTILVFAPLPEFYFTRTSTYKQFEQVILSDPSLQANAGRIKAIGLGSFTHKTRQSSETLVAMLTIFGERQTLRVRADAIIVDGQWIVSLDRDE